MNGETHGSSPTDLACMLGIRREKERFFLVRVSGQCTLLVSFDSPRRSGAFVVWYTTVGEIICLGLSCSFVISLAFLVTSPRDRDSFLLSCASFTPPCPVEPTPSYSQSPQMNQ